MKKFILILSLLLASGAAKQTFSQEGPVNEHYEKKKKEKAKAAKDAEKEIKEHHDDIQSKNTRKMMKKTKKKSKRLKKGKVNDPFFKRLFRKS